jgi:hypothetical protein
MRRAWSETEIGNAVSLALAGENAVSISSKLGRSANAIRYILRSNGVKGKRGRPSLHEDLGCYDGPPIGYTREDEALLDNAIDGSAALLAAIQRAGLSL